MVTAHPHQSHRETISHCIEESFRAVFGFNTNVHTEQLDAYTLEISVVPQQSWCEGMNEGYQS